MSDIECATCRAKDATIQELRATLDASIGACCCDGKDHENDPCEYCSKAMKLLSNLPAAVKARMERWEAMEKVVEAAQLIKAERRKTIQTGTFNSAEMLDAVGGIDDALGRLAALDGEGA